MESKIWFITGVSSGLGKALAEAVIDKGDFVIGTFRNQQQVDAFNILHAGKAHAIRLDISNAEDVQQAFHWVNKQFGRLDFLVNNAGYGLAGSVEETSIEEVREIFEVNFFGVLQVTQKFLPLFRKQRSGHILQISSHGGFKAFAGFGIYNASKFGLEGFSEALAQEIAPLGIRLTIVEPGPLRTEFAGASFRLAQKVIENYYTTAGVFRERIKQVDGKQEGDPIKAAQAIISITTLEHPPLRLPLGKVAILSLTTKIEQLQNEINTFKQLAESVVY